MIVPTAIGPFSTLYILGIPGILAFIISGSILTVYLVGSDVSAGVIGPGDIFAVASATTFVVAYIALFAYMAWVRKLEVFFSSTPWLYQTASKQVKEGTRQYQTRCPFTGLRPSCRCPSCQVRVHDTAFHISDRFINFPEPTVLRWDTAKAVINVEGTKDEVSKARSDLDEVLDYRGNHYFGTIKGCCIGCMTWQRCFNLTPRISLTLALTSLFYAFVPWAFSTFLVLVGQTAGSILQIISGTVAGGFALAALMIQLQALLRVNTFLTRYQDKIPAFKPMFREPSFGLGKSLYKALSAAPWTRD